MRAISYLFIFSSLLVFQTACARRDADNPDKIIPPHLVGKFAKNSFAYPVGEQDFVTEKNDWWDKWYNAQDFGENRHLGEDWNRTTGGDTDCGEAVYAAADGRVVFAGDAGVGWGNVVIIEHAAADGTKVQSLYGHLETIIRAGGEVRRREQVGSVGSANGRYKCHLHFEIRSADCPAWGQTGAGYADRKNGWVDPSEFIDSTRR